LARPVAGSCAGATLLRGHSTKDRLARSFFPIASGAVRRCSRYSALMILPPLAGWAGSAATHPYLVCDVFTDRPLEGNQLAVFLDGRPLTDELMQSAAREMNLAETVFLLPPAAGGDVSMRIFTTAEELPFAGHPVLGTAVVVATALGAGEVTVETGLGPVPVELQRESGRVVSGRMRQFVPVWEPYERVADLLAAVGVERSELPVEEYRNGPRHVYVALRDEDAVAALEPDMAALKALGVAASCFAWAGRTWKTRMFYPDGGVPEDPATGSAAGPLAVHLARHGRIGFGEEIEIRQGEEIGRPSRLSAVATGTADRIETVEVAGSAVIVAEGRYRLSLS
jgi:trans-2,3-dihydro-3-hydroxyanthranilate isomerase